MNQGAELKVEADIQFTESHFEGTVNPVSGVKKAAQVAETTSVNKEEADIPKFSMEPPKLTKEGAPRLFWVFMICTLVVAAILLFLFAREFAIRKQTALELSRTEQARTQLELSLVQLQAEMANQREEINRLNEDLKAAQTKAALTDKEYQAQILKIKSRYEVELIALRKALETKDTLISSLQSNLKSIREFLQRGGQAPVEAMSAITAGGVGPVQSVITSGANLIPPPAEFRPTSGKILMVDKGHHFIVMDLGPSQGAQMGRFVQIYQNDRPLGEGRIDRVYQNLSAASIVSEDTLGRVAEGDQVILALA